MKEVSMSNVFLGQVCVLFFPATFSWDENITWKKSLTAKTQREFILFKQLEGLEKISSETQASRKNMRRRTRLGIQLSVIRSNSWSSSTKTVLEEKGPCNINLWDWYSTNLQMARQTSQELQPSSSHMSCYLFQ